uniref:Predicted protein n=3 Tax=Hordeum vulgare TaxID=4513 RepID=F2E3R9_HORVV|nr:predicted protein [Hordeum vulgare subsp. vulgare]
MSTAQVLLPVPKSVSHHHQRNPLRLAFAHGSTEAFFPPSIRRRPSLHSIRTRSRKISACTAYVESRPLGERNVNRQNMDREARIRKQLQNPKFSPSPYDTAWVAMVPLPGSLQDPCFPQCVEWILQNQHGNGYWGSGEFDSPASRDVLLSTLASVIALKKWNVGPEEIMRGLQFIGRNFSIIMDEQTTAPIGYNLTFSSLLILAIEMGLELPVSHADINVIVRHREMEIERLDAEKSSTKEVYSSYVAEGLVNVLDLSEVMTFQKKNGSLFNSPSATAAALIRNYDLGAFEYLNLIVSEFGSAVPAMYPLTVHYQLSMVDTLQKVGISRFFSEINHILDKTYSLLLKRDDEIMSNVETCAVAFRILRMNRYDVSSDVLSHVAEASTLLDPPQEYVTDTKSLLELYKASKVILSQNELVLEKIEKWSRSLLKEIMCSDMAQRIPAVIEEVEYALKIPFYATVDPLDHKWSIEHFDAMDSHMMKTKYIIRSCGVNKDILALAVEDFCVSQSIYQREVEHLDSWEKECRLGELQFARQKMKYCYLCAAASITPHELSEARVACAKATILTIVIDDFFDSGAGSPEALANLISLAEKWEDPHEDDFHSEEVKILFYALYKTMNQIAAAASPLQNRDVTKELVETWLALMRTEMTEVEWRNSKHLPSFEEYMKVAYVSFALGPIVHTPMYFLGVNFPEHVLRDEEYDELFTIMSSCCRLLNDIRGFERELSHGKLNSTLLLVRHSGGSLSIEEAKQEIQKSIASLTTDLLRLLLREDKVVPMPCKEIFWRFNQTGHLFYTRIDGFTSPEEMVGAVNAVVYDPLKLQGGTVPSLSAQLEN